MCLQPTNQVILWDVQGVITLTLFEIAFTSTNQSRLAGEPNQTKPNQKMKTLIMKLLGLNTLIETVDDMASYTSQLPSAEEINMMVNQIDLLKKENEELKKNLREVSEKVDNMEEFDSDDFVREDDVNDRIESYLNDNEYVSSSYVDDEIESKVSEKVEEAIEELDIEDKVKEVVDDMDKPSFGDTEELKDIIRTVIRDGKIKFE